MLHNVAHRVFNTPLMIEPTRGRLIAAFINDRITGKDQRAGILSDELEVSASKSPSYKVVEKIAVITISGTLVHRGAWIGANCGLTSYQGISAQIEEALSDPYVRGIALELDTGGGEVSGAFDLADQIRAARSQKPVWAFVAEHAYSAGYIIASQADRIIVPRTGGVGSIGAVVMHADYSRALEEDGVNITLIHSGTHKVDGNPYEPLPEDVQSKIQAELDAVRQLFADTVALGRDGKLTADQALATEAQTYSAQQAVDLGLADEVSDIRSAFERFAASVSPAGNQNANNNRSYPMARQDGRDGAATMSVEEANQMVQSAIAAAAADEAQRIQAAVNAAMAERDAKDQADKQRRAEIMGHAEAKGREKLAEALADSGMSSEAAAKALSVAPRSYSASMDEVGGAGVVHQVESKEPQKVAKPIAFVRK